MRPAPLLLLPLLVACGAPQYGASYAGAREPKLVEPRAIRVTDALPYGYDRLGRVAARCQVLRDYRSLDEATLADVDCTQRRLRRALGERAAEVGGELLVALECRRSSASLSCGATVARPSDDTLAARPASPAASEESAPAPSAEDVEYLDEPRVSRSFAITLSFDARSENARPARPLPALERRPTPPAVQAPLGDLEARCDEGACEHEELAHALALAAARIGARALSALRCFDDERGAACVGSLSVDD
jgi:hypothetical protein